MHRVLAPLALVTLASVPAAAEDPRPSRVVCDRTALVGRAYVECLRSALEESDRALAEAFERATAMVEARSDLAATQRRRWKNVLEEAQGRFIHFSNFDCQNVAPYEGSRGRIGIFEERLACLIDKNVVRSNELADRYGTGASPRR